MSGRTRLALQLAFVGVGLAFVVRAVLQGIDAGSFSDVQWMWLLVGFGAAAIAMTLIAARWSTAVTLVGGDLPVSDAVPLYFQGEIGKYIPGAVWAVVGRAELARRAGMARSGAYASVASSLAATYLAGALAAVLLLPFAAGARGAAAVFGVAAFLIVGVVALHPAIVGRVVRLGERVSRRDFDLTIPSWRQAVALVVGYLPGWLAISASHWFCVRALGISAPFTHVAFAAAVSWCAGFLAIPAPGGIGVRESVFVLTSGLAHQDAAAAALLARVTFVVADGAGAALSALWMTRRPAR
ncbi:MAG: flippase-like domain-containing protein [Actinobacteria bacterium]|nr:flippase-like domain-containing protein [Actinomycetota bacterium]